MLIHSVTVTQYTQYTRVHTSEYVRTHTTHKNRIAHTAYSGRGAVFHKIAGPTVGAQAVALRLATGYHALCRYLGALSSLCVIIPLVYVVYFSLGNQPKRKELN